MDADQVIETGQEILEESEQDPRSAFKGQLLTEACMAVARDMECYDYQIGRLIRKVSAAVSENPSWAHEKDHLLRLIRAAATGFGGRRERVWLASFDSSLEMGSPLIQGTDLLE